MKESDERRKKLMCQQIIGKAAEITAAGYGDIYFVTEGGNLAKRPQKQYNKRYKGGSGACVMPVRPKD